MAARGTEESLAAVTRVSARKGKSRSNESESSMYPFSTDLEFLPILCSKYIQHLMHISCCPVCSVLPRRLHCPFFCRLSSHFVTSQHEEPAMNEAAGTGLACGRKPGDQVLLGPPYGTALKWRRHVLYLRLVV